MKRSKRVIPISQESSSRSESPDMPIPKNSHFTFDNLLSVITPPPEVLPTPWKSGFDLQTRTIFFYKVDLENDTLSITKSVRVRCREPLSKNGKPLLIPSLYIGDKKLHHTCATIIMGHEEIQGEEDLMKLLHHVDFCPKILVSADDMGPMEARRPPVSHQQPSQSTAFRTLLVGASRGQHQQEIPVMVDLHHVVSPESVAGPSEEEEPVNLELKATLPYPYSCANCHVDNTTLWRRDPNGNPVCNACGLYYRMYGVARPAVMRRDNIRTRAPKMHRSMVDGEEASGKCSPQQIVATSVLLARRPKKASVARDDLVCSNCATRNTILWRRNLDGNRVCNACALYTKLHGVPRPADLWREEILKRKQKQRIPKGMRATMAPAKRKLTLLPKATAGTVEIQQQPVPHSPGEGQDNHSPTVTLASMILDSRRANDPEPEDSHDSDDESTVGLKIETADSPVLSSTQNGSLKDGE